MWLIKRVIKTLLVLTVIVAILIVAYNLYFYSKYPVRGLDVSHHQGHIQWSLVTKNESIAFVYVKASEGGDFVDPKFAYNEQQAKHFGLETGAYHFFTFCKSGKLQARNFIDVTRSQFKNKHLTLRPVIDLEFGGNCGQKLSEAALKVQIDDFVSEIELILDVRPIFYITKEFLEAYPQVIDYGNETLWLRSLLMPVRNISHAWTLWQYSNFSLVKGISGRVDNNALSGDLAELKIAP